LDLCVGHTTGSMAIVFLLRVLRVTKWMEMKFGDRVFVMCFVYGPVDGNENLLFNIKNNKN